MRSVRPHEFLGRANGYVVSPEILWNALDCWEKRRGRWWINDKGCSSYPGWTVDVDEEWTEVRVKY